MTISERIIDLINQRGMTQKEFSQMTGIAQSSISDWKRKKTNPVSEKIMVICEALQISPMELLSGTGDSDESVGSSTLIIDKSSELGQLIINMQTLDLHHRDLLFGYMKALKESQDLYNQRFSLPKAEN